MPAGPILTTKPGDEGTRPVQIKVYNTPAEATASGAKVSAFQEAPELADKVNKGQLPPISQRLPQDPSWSNPKRRSASMAM